MQLPESINLESPDQYSLLVRITPNKFTYFIYETDCQQNNYLAVMPFSMKNDEIKAIENTILDLSFLTLSYHSVNVIYVSEEYDLVPQYMIWEEKKSILYNFTHYQNADHVLYTSEPVQQVTTLYNLDGELYKFLARNLYKAEFYHHSNLLLQYLEQKNKSLPNTAKLYLSFQDEFVDVFCYDNQQRILYAMTFKNTSDQDLLYHILNIWDKCGFDQKIDYVYILTGYANASPYIVALLSEYLKNIKSIPVDIELDMTESDELDSLNLPLDALILLAK